MDSRAFRAVVLAGEPLGQGLGVHAQLLGGASPGAAHLLQGPGRVAALQLPDGDDVSGEGSARLGARRPPAPGPAGPPAPPRGPARGRCPASRGPSASPAPRARSAPPARWG